MRLSIVCSIQDQNTHHSCSWLWHELASPRAEGDHCYVLVTQTLVHLVATSEHDHC